ncbi:MAG: hypothetical protein V4534_06925 [Myxococcota bacterium]
MATRYPRINATFKPETAILLSELAVKENKSVSSIVQELTLEALERREDFLLSALADKLDSAGSKTYSHDEAWK